MKHSNPTDNILLQALYTLIQDRTGIILNPHQCTDLAGWVEKKFYRAKVSNTEKGITTYEAWFAALQSEPTNHPLWQEMISLITVNETYFFRNQDQFNALRLTVLPTLIEKRRAAQQKHLRIWCAGCASGEEPYSVAMLLRDLIPDIETWQITLIASDINKDNLERAQRGIYRSWSFRNETPDEIRTRWFTCTTDGFKNETYKLASTICNMVIFRTLNLISDNYPTFESGTMNMDLIICRNVTIYFDQETTRKIVKRFYDALIDEAWLVVGHAEPMSSLYQGFVARNFPNAVLYQKQKEQTRYGIDTINASADPRKTSDESKPIKVTLQAASSVVTGQPQKVTASLIKPAEVSLPTSSSRTSNNHQTTDVLELLKQAWAAADHEEWNTALDWLAKVEQTHLFLPHVHYLYGVVYWNLGNVETALESLRQTLYCDPDYVLAHYLLGEIHTFMLDKPMAQRHWKLAKKAMEALDPQQVFPFTDDLTVEMLTSLVVNHLRG